MNEQSTKEKLEQLEAERLIKDRIAAETRAMSISVGTAFGGATEVSMRLMDGRSTWCIMQPVEVIELIHQLAANVGCHIALKPRRDFASWRDWRVTEEEKVHLNGWAPFVNDMAPFMQIGRDNLDQEKLKMLDEQKAVETGGGRGGMTHEYRLPHKKEPKNSIDRSTQNAMATEKSKNRRSTKRTPKAS